jgi:serine/threonine protein kinase
LILSEKTAKPPWVKLIVGRDGNRLTKQGAKSGQVANLNKLLNKFGVGYYSLFFQSCDRLSPLMDLVWIAKLGEGAFGQVHLVRNKHRNIRTALKLIKVEDDEVLKGASKEMQHHQKAAEASDFVVNVCTWGQVSDDFLFVELEFCAGGDIRKTLDAAEPPRSGMADSALRWKLYLQICQGLKAIHATGLIHMDLKPENVLLTASLDARIADLGLATLVEGDTGTNRQTHVGGTKGYQAPEVATTEFSSKADIYSLAIMFFEMATGRLPDITSDAAFDPLNGEPATLELVQFMLKLKSAERPTASELVGYIEILTPIVSLTVASDHCTDQSQGADGTYRQ